MLNAPPFQPKSRGVQNRPTIFDYNGVLVDDEEVHLAAFRDALRPLGVQVTDQDYWDRYIGFDDVAGFRTMLRDAGKIPTDAQIRDLVDLKAHLYLERARRELRSFPGAAETVRRRAVAGPVVIVSGALRAEIELGLTVLGISDCVAHIVSAEDAKSSKPDPEGYLLALDWLVLEVGEDRAHRAVVIEDSVAGVQAAKAALLECIAVGHSYPEQALRAVGADDFFPTIGGIPDSAFAIIGS